MWAMLVAADKKLQAIDGFLCDLSLTICLCSTCYLSCHKNRSSHQFLKREDPLAKTRQCSISCYERCETKETNKQNQRVNTYCNKFPNEPHLKIKRLFKRLCLFLKIINKTNDVTTMFKTMFVFLKRLFLQTYLVKKIIVFFFKIFILYFLIKYVPMVTKIQKTSPKPRKSFYSSTEPSTWL